MDPADMTPTNERPAAERPPPAPRRGWLTRILDPPRPASGRPPGLLESGEAASASDEATPGRWARSTAWAVLYAVAIWGWFALVDWNDSSLSLLVPPLALAFLGGVWFRSRSWPLGTLLGVVLAVVAYSGYFFTTPESSAADAGQGVGLILVLSVFYAALAYAVAWVGVACGRELRG